MKFLLKFKIVLIALFLRESGAALSQSQQYPSLGLPSSLPLKTKKSISEALEGLVEVFDLEGDSLPLLLLGKEKIKIDPSRDEDENALAISVLNRIISSAKKKLSKLKASSSTSVIELDSSNFKEEVLESDQLVFVKFYAPWCGHCKALAPVWAQLPLRLKSKVKVAKVDATKHTDLAQRYNVQGFPTLLLFHKKKFIAYQGGGRDLDSLENFALSHFKKIEKKKPLTEIVNQSQFEEECKSHLCLLVFLPNILDSKESERLDYLKMLAKAENGDVKKFWIEAGNSLDFERSLRLEFGWPAAVVLDLKNGKYVVGKSSFNSEALSSLMQRSTKKRTFFETLPSDLPQIKQVEKWKKSNNNNNKKKKDEL